RYRDIAVPRPASLIALEEMGARLRDRTADREAEPLRVRRRIDRRELRRFIERRVLQEEQRRSPQLIVAAPGDRARHRREGLAVLRREAVRQDVNFLDRFE